MKKINLPKEGAGRKLAAHLKKSRQQRPPRDMIDKINNTVKKKALSYGCAVWITLLLLFLIFIMHGIVTFALYVNSLP